MLRGVVLCVALVVLSHAFPNPAAKMFEDRMRALNARAANEAKNRPTFGIPDKHIFLTHKTTVSQKPKETFDEMRMRTIKQSSYTDPTDFLKVNTVTFGNGVTVLHKQDTSAPLLSVVFSYHVGSRHETERTQGVAHLLEHMMFKGTYSRPLQWGRLFYVLGSATNAFTTFGQTAYFHTIHKTALEPLLELELDRMKNITLTEEQFNKEKKVVMSELTGNRNSPIMILNEKVMEAAYRGYWPGRSIGGKSVMDLTRDDANDFYLRAYRPGCLTLVVVGDIDFDSLLRKLDRSGVVSLGLDNLHEMAKCEFDIPTPVPITLKPGYNPAVQEDHKVIMKDDTTDMAVLQYVVPLCNLTSIDDVAALQVFEAILNGGLLMESVKSVGGEAGCMGFFEEDSGWMIVMAGVQPGDFNSVLRLDEALSGDSGLFEAIQRNASSVIDPMVVAQAISAVVDKQRAEWFSSLESTAIHLAIDQTLTGDYLYTQRLLNRTKLVTLRDISRVAAKYFRKERFVVGTLSRGTAAEAEETRERFGGVEKFTEHESVNNTAAYFESIQCHIPTADDVLSYVAGLRYEDVYSEELPGGETRGQSVPISPPLCFDDDAKCTYKHSYKPPRPMYLKLKNGMQLLAQEDLNLDDTDSTFIYGYVDAGMEFDPPDYEGTALMTALTLQLNMQMHIITSMMAKQFGGMPPNGNLTPDMIKSLGSIPDLAIAPQLEGMLIRGETDCKSLDVALEALHFALTDAQMLSAREHQQMQSMLGDMVSRMSQDPSFAVRRLLLEQIYPSDHPQLRSPTRESINRIPLELVQKFYINRVCPETVKLVVVSGQYSSDATATINRMAELFEKWPACSGRAKSPPRNTTRQSADRLVSSATQRNVQASSQAGEANPIKAFADMFKRVSGKSDDDIRTAESQIIAQARDTETTLKRGFAHGSEIIANAVQNLVPLQNSLLSQFTSPDNAHFRDDVASAKSINTGFSSQVLDSAIQHVTEQQQAAHVPQGADQLELALLETDQIQIPMSRPGEIPSHMQPPQPVPVSSRVAKVFENEQKLAGQIRKTVSSGESLFLDFFFGGTDNPSDAFANFANSAKTQTPSFAFDEINLGQLAGFRADGGFGFLDALSSFKKHLRNFAEDQAARLLVAKQDAHPALSLLASTSPKTRPAATVSLPKFMQPLFNRASQSRNPHPNPDEVIPGLAMSKPQIHSMDDMGSVLALSWLDLARELVQSGPTSKFASSSLETSVLASALMNLADTINTRALSKSAPQFSRVQQARERSHSLDQMAKGLYYNVEERMNSFRARLEQSMSGFIPQSVLDNLESSVHTVSQKPLHLPSLQQFNQELSAAITRLQSHIKQQSPQYNSLQSLTQEFHALQPDIAALIKVPMRALQDAQANPPADTATKDDAEGSNSQREPSRGGVLGMFQLPDIPSEPHYPPPKNRNGVTWIRKKVPGLHEAITVMLTDTVLHGDRDLIPAMVGNHILGGNSLSGKLGYWIRDCKGLTYHVASQMSVGRSSSLLTLQMQTQTGAALDRAVNDTLNIMQDIKLNGFTQAEMNAAKRNLVSMANIQASDSRVVAQKIMMDMVYAQRSPAEGRDTNMWTSTTQHLIDLRLSDLNRTASNVFRPSRLVILSLANDLEDDIYPNPDLDQDYLTPVDPEGTKDPEGEGGDCRQPPPGEEGNPYRTGEPELYVPPTGEENVEAPRPQLMERVFIPPGAFAH